MGAGHYFKIFDVTVSGFKDWQFPAFGLIFVLIGTSIFFAPALIKRSGIPFLNFPSKRLTFFRYVFLGFALSGQPPLSWQPTSPTAAIATWPIGMLAQSCKAPVTNFIPMPYEGHADESFSVSGIQFRYSDYGVSDAFNNAASHGGPITKDSFVRICYDPADNAILRLEIRDFRKKPKDYAQGDSLFGDVGEAKPKFSPANVARN